MQAILFDIQRFCVHDGPGIRTTVFFKGCNLKCFWCHNPESINAAPEMQYLSMKCIGCGKCAACCPNGCHTFEDGMHRYDRAACQLCGRCAQACDAEALSWAGRRYTVQEALDVALRDKPFYDNSGGGITCSGGEPMLQKDFLLELLKRARAAGLHTAVDTAGNVPFEWFIEILPHTDLFLYDLKCMDNGRHREATGVGNGLILDNLAGLSQAGARIWVRIPVIPPVNGTLCHMRQAAEYLAPLPGIEKVELLTFHRLGGGKYESLGGSYDAMGIKPFSKEEMLGLAKPFHDRNLEVKVS
jgi:pyruvate formate lyase activating enzyme